MGKCLKWLDKKKSEVKRAPAGTTRQLQVQLIGIATRALFLLLSFGETLLGPALAAAAVFKTSAGFL